MRRFRSGQRRTAPVPRTAASASATEFIESANAAFRFKFGFSAFIAAMRARDGMRLLAAPFGASIDASRVLKIEIEFRPAGRLRRGPDIVVDDALFAMAAFRNMRDRPRRKRA